jgi:hypothetical protein
MKCQIDTPVERGGITFAPRAKHGPQIRGLRHEEAQSAGAVRYAAGVGRRCPHTGQERVMSYMFVSRLVVLAGAILVLSSIGGRAVAQSSLQVIATGLDNPRGLAFGPDGALYVAEAGRGGTTTLCAPSPDPPFTPRCYGPSGAITRIQPSGAQQRVVVGLPSIAGPSGDIAAGPQDVDFGMGRAWVTIGFGNNPALRAPFIAAGVRMASLVRVLPTGQWDAVVDIGDHEAGFNPDGRFVDTNPFGLRMLADRALVIDAGGNSLLQITPSGTISTLAVFPTRPSGPSGVTESVPTAVVEGPDGDLFVGELTGQPFPVGGARIFRVPRNGGTPVVVAAGFTTIIDVALAANGVGYVLEHDSDGIIPPLGPGVTGRLVRINRDGTQTVLTTALVKPGGIAVGPDGAVYVTTRSIFAGTGEVVRVVP